MAKAEQVGALWRHHSERAGEYFTGRVDGQSVIIFRNAYKGPKDRRKRPDLIVYRAKRQEEGVRGGVKQ